MFKIKKNLGISLSVGLISGTWALVAEMLGVPPWPGFIGWSIFFFAGSNIEAIKKSFPCLALGAVLAYITAYIQTTLGTAGLASAVVVVGLGFFMTYAQNLSIFALTAATFIGANIYFASGNLLYSIVIPFVGLLFGPVSIKLGQLFDSIILKDNNRKALKENSN